MNDTVGSAPIPPIETDDPPPTTADAVIIGAGLVGAAVTAALAATGRQVCLVDRTGLLGGTTAAGEGDILVSDKLPGPELALAVRSLLLWRQFAAEHGADIEFDPKGGLVVAHTATDLEELRRLADRQRAAGVVSVPVPRDGLRDVEPFLSPALAGAVYYPQDCQVQPMRAAAAFFAAARRRSATLVTRAEAVGLRRSADRQVAAVVTSRGRIATRLVVNAAGPWSGEVARRLGTDLPVRPRRGHILVTEPLPPLIRHKVYEADYVGTVVTDDDTPACSAVVEGTAGGTVLIGSSREYAGFDRRCDPRVLAEMARRAVAVFPFLARVRAVRAYTGFRPASPDHLPIIGPDPTVPGLFHVTGHEGAGIGLAPASAELVTALVEGTPTAVDPTPFTPARFTAASAGTHVDGSLDASGAGGAATVASNPTAGRRREGEPDDQR